MNNSAGVPNKVEGHWMKKYIFQIISVYLKDPLSTLKFFIGEDADVCSEFLVPRGGFC